MDVFMWCGGERLMALALNGDALSTLPREGETLFLSESHAWYTVVSVERTMTSYAGVTQISIHLKAKQ